MKTLHFSIIVIACAATIGTTFVLINFQPTKNESTKYAFEGDYEISHDMKTTFNNKPFFVSKAGPEFYNGMIMSSNCVNFDIPQSSGPPNPSGFIQTSIYFPDGIIENLTTGYGGHPPTPVTKLTKHEDPQAGITWYADGSVNLLVSDDNQTGLSSLESPNVSAITIPDGMNNPQTTKNFVPRILNVTIGVNNTVRWTNEGDMPIIIMASQDSCHSLFVDTGHYLDSGGIIKKGGSYNYTFTKAGKFRYISQWPWANGWVQVSENQ
jgi:plastocyanin